MESGKKEHLILGLIVLQVGVIGIILHFFFPYDVFLIFFGILFIFIGGTYPLLPNTRGKKFRPFDSFDIKALMGFGYGIGIIVLVLWLYFILQAFTPYSASAILPILELWSLGIFGTYLYLKRRREKKE